MTDPLVDSSVSRPEPREPTGATASYGAAQLQGEARIESLPASAAGSASRSPTGRPSGPREPQWRVARSAIGLWTVGAIGTALVVLIPVSIAAVLIPDSAVRWLVVVTDILPWVLAAFFVVEILALPWYKYAVHRWEVTPDGVYTLTGWLSRTWILVPISRIQTVDVTRGPLQRMFGLASVSVRTASAHGSVEIHQLDAYTAAQVADDLSKRANLYDDDAT